MSSAHTVTRIFEALDKAEAGAWEALARADFDAYGRAASLWTSLASLLDVPPVFPFQAVVQLGRAKVTRRKLEAEAQAGGVYDRATRRTS